MKLPIIEKLETLKTGRRVAVSPRIAFDSTESVLPYENKIELETKLVLSMKQFCSESAPISCLHERAVYSFQREIYGPVEERILEILRILWENAHYDDKAIAAVEELMNDLRV